MSDLVLIVLLTFHLAGAIVWLGGSLFFAFVVSSTFKRMERSLSLDFLGVVLPKFRRYVAASSIVTLITGILLFGYLTTASSNSSLVPTGWRLFVLILGGVLGFVAFIVALGVLLPTTSKILQHLDDDNANPSSSSSSSKIEEALNLGNAIGSSSKAVSVLLLIVLTLMVLGVNL